MWGTPGFHCGLEPIFAPFASPTITTEWNPASWLFPPQKGSCSFLPAKQSQKCLKTMNGFMAILIKRRNVKPRVITIVKWVCYHALQIQLKSLKINWVLCVLTLFWQNSFLHYVMVENVHILLFTVTIYKGENKKILATGTNAEINSSWLL